VRGQDNGEALLGRQSLEQVDDGPPGGGIQVARGLIGNQDFGIGDETARDGDALHLSARKFARQMVGAVGEPHRRQNLARGSRVDTLFEKHQRQLDIFRYREGRQQRELLENETEQTAPHLHQVVLRQARDGSPVHDERALGRGI